MTTKELLEQRAGLILAAQKILNDSEAEKRDLGVEDEQRFDKLMADADGIDAQLRAAKRKERVDAAAASLEQPMQRISLAYGKATREARSADEYQAAFRHYLTTADATELRVMSVGANGNGGYTVPETVEARIVEKLRQSSVIRSISRVTQTPDDRKIPIQNAIPTAAIIDEGVQITASDATFTQLSIGAYKYGVRVVASRELLDDSGVNLEEYVIRTGSEAIARAQDEHFWDGAGSGSTQPAGVINGAGTAITAVTLPTGNTTSIASTAATVDKIIEWAYELPVQYRAGAAIVTSDQVIMNLRKLKDANDHYIWTPTPVEQMMTQGSPGTILGKPYYISEYVDALAASKHVAVMGNFNYYEIYDRGATEVIVDPYTLSDKYQIQMMVVKRTDATRTLDEAFVTLKTSAT